MKNNKNVEIYKFAKEFLAGIRYEKPIFDKLYGSDLPGQNS